MPSFLICFFFCIFAKPEAKQGTIKDTRMFFSDIIGQEEIKTRFRNTVLESRIPHAQLLHGVEGVGKLRLAIAYAQYIACENRTEKDACGTCPSCLKYNKLAHPDLHFVFPIVKPANKTSVVCDDFIGEFRQMVLSHPYFGVNDWLATITNDTKQGVIYANESDEIIRKLNLKTYESEYKVMIVWLPEKMHTSCANKLLKVLEEPSEKTVFLLVSNSPDEIITTILSRTQQIKVPTLSNEEIENALLKEKDFDVSVEDAQYVARIANGSYLKALRITSENEENKQNFDRFVQLMRLAWLVGNKKDHASLKTLRRWADDLAAGSVGREAQKNFLAYAQRMIRENFILNLHQTELNYMTVSEDEFSERFSAFIHERNIEDLTNEFALAERHIEQNVNAKMVFFDLALKTIMLLKR